MSDSQGGQSSTEPNTMDDVQLDMPDPPQDWKFNNFLATIAEAISEAELETMKNLFIGIFYILNYFKKYKSYFGQHMYMYPLNLE